MLFPSDRPWYWLTWKQIGFLLASPAPWSSELWHPWRPWGCKWQGGETRACHQQLWAQSELSLPWNHKLNITVSESVTEEWTACHHLFVRAQMARVYSYFCTNSCTLGPSHLWVEIDGLSEGISLSSMSTSASLGVHRNRRWILFWDTDLFCTRS